jgi:hypothetical protein
VVDSGDPGSSCIGRIISVSGGAAYEDLLKSLSPWGSPAGIFQVPTGATAAFPYFSVSRTPRHLGRVTVKFFAMGDVTA